MNNTEREIDSDVETTHTCNGVGESEFSESGVIDIGKKHILMTYGIIFGVIVIFVVPWAIGLVNIIKYFLTGG